MSLLRQRMLEEMQVRNLATSTQEAYIQVVAKYATSLPLQLVERLTRGPLCNVGKGHRRRRKINKCPMMPTGCWLPLLLH